MHDLINYGLIKPFLPLSLCSFHFDTLPPDKLLCRLGLGPDDSLASALRLVLELQLQLQAFMSPLLLPCDTDLLLSYWTRLLRARHEIRSVGLK